MSKKPTERIDPRGLGISPSSMDPMETIAMEGNFYRGIATRDHKRKWPMRLMGALVGTLFVGSACFAFFAGFSDGLWGIIPLLLAILFLFVGTKMILANIL